MYILYIYNELTLRDDRNNLKKMEKKADMSMAAAKAAYLRPKTAIAAAAADHSLLRKAVTKVNHLAGTMTD